MDKVLITGSSGFVGKNLMRVLKNTHKVFGLDHKESVYTTHVADITDKKAVRKIVGEVNPHVIVHTAALANVEYVEMHQNQAYEINVGGTENLLESVKGTGAHFIFISSDYVYDGIQGNFTEASKPNPISWYGQNKLEAEKIVEQYEHHLILRPTVIFGWDPGGKNFFMQLLGNQREKRVMRAPKDQVSNPTYVELLTKVIEKSIAKELTGTFIATGPESLDRYAFGVTICDVFGFDANFLIPLETKGLGQIAKRPLNCSTDSSRLRHALDMDFPSLKESLRELKSLSNNSILRQSFKH